MGFRYLVASAMKAKQNVPAYRLIPAAHFHFLTPAFDLLCVLSGLGTRFAERIVRRVQIPLEAWKGQPTLGNGDWATQKPM